MRCGTLEEKEGHAIERKGVALEQIKKHLDDVVATIH